MSEPSLYVLSSDHVGGADGYNDGGTVSSSYATGSVGGWNSARGGLIGYNQATVTDSYYDDEAAGTTSDCGPTYCAGSTGLSIAEMVLQSSFIAFDFDSSSPEWVITEGYTSPRLAWEPAWSPPSQDSDQDGVPDETDNCIDVPNGPLASTGSFDSQEDSDLDGYGNACDADVNNDAGVGLDDAGIGLGKLNTAGGSSDLNCDGGVGLDDVGAVLSVLDTGPGLSGLARAGTVPCEAGL